VPPEETQSQRLERAIADLREKARVTYAEAARPHVPSSDPESAEPRAAMLRVPIESKLGLGPSDPQSRPRTSGDAVPARRARSHRRTP